MTVFDRMTKHRCVHDGCKTKMVSFEEDRVYTAASRFTVPSRRTLRWSIRTSDDVNETSEINHPDQLSILRSI